MLVALLHAAGLAAVVAALAMLVARRRLLPRDLVAILASILVILAFNHVGNVLQWSRLSSIADESEQYLIFLLPPLWVALLFLWNRESSSAHVRESEERYRSLVELSPMAVIVHSGGRILYANPAAARLTAVAEASGLVGSTLAPTLVLCPQTMPGCALEDLAGNGVAAPGKLTARDGAVRDVELHQSRVSYEGVEARQLLVRDVTEQRAAERRIAFQADLLERVSDAIVATDEQFRILAWNGAAEIMYGHRREDVVGRPARGVLQTQVSDEERKRFLDRAIEQGYAEAEAIQRRADGTPIDVESRVASIRDEAGRVTGFVSVNRDVTERRGAERKLRETEERLRLLASVTDDAVWNWNLRTDEVTWNQGIRKLFGYEESTVGGDSAWWKSRIHPDDRERVEKGVVALIDSGERFWSDEYRYRRADGRYSYVLDRGYVIHDERREPIRMIGAMLDLTERRKLENELAQARKMESIGRLAGGIAHDFNNLLTVIGGSAEILAAKVGADRDLLERVSHIRQASDRAAELTHQLLAFARKQPIEPRPLSFADVLVESSDILARLIGEDVELESRVDDDLWLVRADPSQMVQLLINLASNARDAMPKGGRLALAAHNVHVEGDPDRTAMPALEPGEYVRLRVRDDGMGMSEETRVHVFEPFFTTKETGTGLGLATCYGIVKQSGGFIFVDSRPEAGTTFDIYLPRERAEALVETPHELRAAREKAQGRILFVEDEELVRRFAAEVLRNAGYEVIEASNGEEALHVAEARNEPIDLLVTDVVMPRLGGHDLANRLGYTHANLRVLFISGYASGLTMSAESPAAELDRVPLLSKPFSSSALRERVQEVLEAAPPSLPRTPPVL